MARQFTDRASSLLRVDGVWTNRKAPAVAGVTVALLVVLAAYVAFRAYALVVTNHVAALWLKDFRLYMDATHRFLDGGGFYPASQLAGPWVLEWGAILYPPVSLVLFVPFALLEPTLAAFLWLVIPAWITAAIVWSWRPSLAGWAAIFALLAIEPLSLLNWTAGTPTTWLVAFAALATRWPAASALILVKPTVLPFALTGIRHRSWWLVAGALAVLSLGSLDWLVMLTRMSGEDAGLLYSAANLPLLAIPWISRATGAGVMSPRP